MSKRLQQKKLAARKVRVKRKLAQKREKLRAEAKFAKMMAELRQEMNDESRIGDTSTTGSLLRGNHSPTENRTDV